MLYQNFTPRQAHGWALAPAPHEMGLDSEQPSSCGRLWLDLRIDEVVATGSSRVLAGYTRSVFRRIGRKWENLDLVLVVRQPFLKCS